MKMTLAAFRRIAARATALSRSVSEEPSWGALAELP
jgi:hypothetical protein